MQTYCIKTILQTDGTITLHHLPFRAGDPVEVVVLANPSEEQISSRYPLRGTPLQYIDPTEPVAQSDWGTLP